MLPYLSAFATALIASWVLTPVARKLAMRLGVVDRPDVRKVHRAPTPYLGGAAIFAALVLGFVALVFASGHPRDVLAALDPRLYWLIGGGVAMFTLGLVDDVRRLRARHKLLGQVLVATAMWLGGIRIETVQITESLQLDFGVFGFFITVLWIAGVTNAINLIDGLDGLAVGIASISAAAIGYVAWQAGQLPSAAMLAVLLAALLGFLPHNRHPAKIFLGDAGSLLIGFLLATSAITSASKSTAFASVGAPFLALCVPILDMCFAMLRRMVERRGIFSPDKNHIHHRLMALGYGHAKTVAILWCESALLTALALVMLYTGSTNVIRITAFGIVLLLHVLFFRATGAVRLRDSYQAFVEATARLRQSNEQRRHYDELELHFRSTRTFDEWWQAVELSAGKLGFARLSMKLERRNGGPHEVAWPKPPGTPPAIGNGVVHTNGSPHLIVTLPLRHRRAGPLLELHVELPLSNLETAGQHLTLFGRLLDRHSIATLPRRPSTREIPKVIQALPRNWQPATEGS